MYIHSTIYIQLTIRSTVVIATADADCGLVDKGPGLSITSTVYQRVIILKLVANVVGSPGACSGTKIDVEKWIYNKIFVKYQHKTLVQLF